MFCGFGLNARILSQMIWLFWFRIQKRVGVSEGTSFICGQHGQGVDDQWRGVGQPQPDVDQDRDTGGAGRTPRLGGAVQDVAASRRGRVSW